MDLASNGKEAVEMVQDKEYDIIFMDIQMPVMSGLEAAKHIRDQGVKIPIIAVTAHALKEDREACLSCGMNDYMTKPVNKDLVFSLLMEYLQD